MRIELPCFGIAIVLAIGDDEKPLGGVLTSDLHDDDESPTLKAALDGLEAMILAMAVAEPDDVESPAFLAAIDGAVDAIGNQYG